MTGDRNDSDVTEGDAMLLTVKEAAQVLRLSRAFTYELVARGDLPVVRFGRRVLIPRAALMRHVEGLVADTQSPARPA